ncbi:hypothetical protein MHIMP23_07795 [Methylobacterium hispanicum]
MVLMSQGTSERQDAILKQLPKQEKQQHKPKLAGYVHMVRRIRLISARPIIGIRLQRSRIM